jgi:hypothetical protein
MIGSYHSSVTLTATAAPSAMAFPSWLLTRVALNHHIQRGFKWTFRTTRGTKPGPHISVVVANSFGRFPRSTRDPTTALAKPDRNKPIALARGAENDLVAVF